jgi:DNA polymerase I
MTLVRNEHDVEVFRAWLRRQKILAIDTETNITENDHERFLVGASFYAPGDEPWYVPFGHEHPFLPVENVPLWDFSKGINKDALLIFHNAKFDLKVLRRVGIDLINWNIVDTMLWHHLLDSYHPPRGWPGHALESLEVHLLKKDTKKDLVKKIRAIRKDYGMEAVPPFVMATYASNDVVSTYQLYELFLPQMEEWLLLPIWAVDQEFMKLLVLLEESGLRIDRSAAQRLAEDSKERMDQIRRVLPFDPAKDLQAIDGFFSEPPKGLGLHPSKQTRGGRPSVDESVLTGINHPEAGLLLEYRGLQKARSTWFEGFLTRCDQDGYLHPTFKQHGTLTHRLSAENPNPQQIPREGTVKALFMPDEGCDLVEFDYRTVEFRLGAVYADVKSLLEVFRNNGDLHQTVAERLGIPRPIAKNVNFTIIYLGGAEVLMFKYGVPRKEAQRIISDYRSMYPEIFAFARRCQDLAEKRGWIRYWDGRLRIFKHKYECKDAWNSLIQGGAFQIIKRSMLELAKEGIDIRNQIHDAVWLNLPKGYDLSIIEKIMVGWTEEQFGIPFHVEHKILHA